MPSEFENCCEILMKRLLLLSLIASLDIDAVQCLELLK
jgi:hypothetical protein